MSKTVAVIQARLNSTRLPNKVILPIYDGRGSLDLMIERVGRCELIDEIRLAFGKEDYRLREIADLHGLRYIFHEDEDDVLTWFYRLTNDCRLDDVIVRLTADCPLIDVLTIWEVLVPKRLKVVYQYESNTGFGIYPPARPDGFDVEAFDYNVLREAFFRAKTKYEREHVTPWIQKNSKSEGACYGHHTHLRLTLDTAEDLEVIRAIYAALYPINPQFSLDDIIRFLDDHPDIVKINQHLSRNYNCKEPSNE